MKQNKLTHRIRNVLGLAASLILGVTVTHTAQAYDTYDAGCAVSSCHGDFRSSPSPKGTVFSGDTANNNNHNMHRYVMATDCELCHTSPDRFPVHIGSSDGVGTVTGLGCSGCHVGAGLRKHHVAKVSASNCYSTATGCHHQASETVPSEDVISPPYYGTAYTLVEHPRNTAQVANTNENWSAGDFVGLDNDGNGLADLADYKIGPFRILSEVREGNDLRVTWLTAGGRTNTVQAAGNVSGTYTNLSSAINIPGTGLVTNNYLEVGGATKPSRFYRLKSQFP